MDVSHTKIIVYYMYYIMAGNFRGVLIFVIFVVDLAIMKFPLIIINDY